MSRPTLWTLQYMNTLIIHLSESAVVWRVVVKCNCNFVGYDIPSGKEEQKSVLFGQLKILFWTLALLKP